MFCFHLRDYNALGFCFPADSINKTFFDSSHFKNDTVTLQHPIPKYEVWASPFSLAATKGITSTHTALHNKM
jgi:hypothetical protein